MLLESFTCSFKCTYMWYIVIFHILHYKTATKNVWKNMFSTKRKSQNFVLLFTCLEKQKFKIWTKIEWLIHKQNQLLKNLVFRIIAYKGEGADKKGLLILAPNSNERTDSEVYWSKTATFKSQNQSFSFWSPFKPFPDLKLPSYHHLNFWL